MTARKNIPEPIAELRRARSWPKGVPMPEAGAWHGNARWTYEDDEALRRYYPPYGEFYAARLLGRTLAAVISRANALGILREVRARRRWTPAELKLLKGQYGRVDVHELAERLGRNYRMVTDKARQLGLTSPSKLWTADDDEYVRSHYDTLPVAEIARHLGRTANSVMTRAREELDIARRVKPITPEVVARIMESVGRVAITTIVAELGIGADRIMKVAHKHGYRPRGQWWKKQWSAKEDAILRKHYATTRGVDLARRLGCTHSMIENRARVLGLPLKKKQGRSKTRWSRADDALLRKLYDHRSTKELALRFNCTAREIEARRRHLRLRRPDTISVPRRWSEAEDALLRELAGSTDRKEIAQRLGRSRQAVTDRADRLGVMCGDDKLRRWQPEEDNILRSLWKQASVAELAAQLGRTVLGVRHRLQKLDLVERRSTQTPKAWTEEDSQALVTLYGKMPYEEIAARLGRTVVSVASQAYRTGLTRKHVQEGEYNS